MSKRFPDQPAHPERNCWGCDRLCSAKDLLCGNGSVRTPHPSELFGEDWANWADHVPRIVPITSLEGPVIGDTAQAVPSPTA